MNRSIYTLFISLLLCVKAFATGEPSTYFNIYVPPNNDAVHRDVALIVTAIYDSTYIDIVDDDMDGDSDDSYSGYLMAGQSYVLYIKDNGINDDARYASGGILKSDGDYFTITANQLVYASQSTNSDWQFDYVPSVNKSSRGNKFIIYAPNTSNSNRDLNVFAYEDGTTVTIKKISTSSHTQTGKNTVDINQDDVVLQQTLDIGQDIIHYYSGGRDIMESGHTYLIETNKAVTIQYGALWVNSRDGGAYVPSSNGSSSGELFYFTVPYQRNKEQEIRIVSWDSSNTVKLYRYSSGSWVNMKNWSLDAKSTADWVGRTENASYSTVFKIECSKGKKVSVFTANWLETGNPGTSDIATMVSSRSGTTSGNEFICYMAPPGNEHNVTDPFSGQKFGGSFTHLYLFANDSANVTVTDVNSNGQKFNRIFRIAAGKYADCALSLHEWQSIYNGDGNAASGLERPYLYVQSDANIAVMNTNFNDNWMMYFGSSLEQSFNQKTVSSQNEGIPGDTVKVISKIEISSIDPIKNVNGKVSVGSGAIPQTSVFYDSISNTSIQGNISTSDQGSQITFDSLPDLNDDGKYSIVTDIVLLASENDGSALGENAVVTVESTVTGMVGNKLQQSTSSQGVSNAVSNSSNLLFSKIETGAIVNTATDSWNSSWVDYDNDGDADLFLTTRDRNQVNRLYRNDGNGVFVQINQNGLLTKTTQAMSSAWADIDNDGDMDVLIVNNNYDPLQLYLNDGNGNFYKRNNAGFSKFPAYYHGAAWADYNQDGYLDLIVGNYFQSRFHELYLNKGNNTFELQSQSIVSQTSGQTVKPIWIDYDNDGLVDLFFPNNHGQNNLLFKNTGGRFVKIDNEITGDGGNSVAACWGDIDNDGDFDLFVANSSGQKDFLYLNNGDGSFQKDTNSILSSELTNTHGCSFIDVDNDMDLDLYLTDDQGSKQLFIQNPNGSFSKKLDEQLVTNYGNSYGQAVADYNQDGHLDIFVSTHGNENNFLWENNGNENHFISLKLIGTISNRNAIGTRVSLKSGGIWQYKWVSKQNGFGSENEITQHFGLSSNSIVDSIIIEWPSGFKQIETNVQADRFISITESASTLVSGVVFNDINSNCTKDSLESGVAHQVVLIEPGGFLAQTDNKGRYEFSVAPGNYTVSFPSSNNWNSKCSPIAITATQNLTPIENQNIGIEALHFVADLSIEYGSSLWRRGFTNQAFMRVENIGTQTAYNISADLMFPLELEVMSSSIPFQLINSNEYRWSIDSLRAGEVFLVQLEDSVLLSAFIGQELEVTAKVTEAIGEVNLKNNTNSFKELVVGAIDPNDLLAWPKPIENSPYALVSAFDTITYKVRFQNVGTFEAAHVYIHSTLPSHVAQKDVRFISESHNGTISIQDHEIVWTFRNINLPDSSTNEKESHGFVLYSIIVDRNLSNGTEFLGEAKITFDYEDPMITNKVIHRLINQRSHNEELLLWPNPASQNDLVWISAKTNEEGVAPVLESYSILSLSGKLLHQVRVSAKRIPIKINEHLAPAVYMIKAIDKTGNAYHGKLIVQ